MPAPNSDEIARRKKFYEDIWEEARAGWQTQDELYNLEYKVQRIEAASVYRPPTGPSKVDAMVDSLVTTDPVVTRKAKRPGEKHSANANKVEEWGQALLERANREEMTPPFKTMAKNFSLYGYAIGRTAWNDTAWTKKPRRVTDASQAQFEAERATDFPFILEAPHPYRVLLPPSKKQPEMAIDVTLRLARDVKAQYPTWDDSGGDEWRSVEVIAHWDKLWQGVMIGDQSIKSVPNKWGFIPYCHAYAGFGHERIKDWQAKDTIKGGLHPEHLAQGLLAKSVDAIVAEAEYLTAVHHLAMSTVYRVGMTTEDAGDLAQKMAEAGLSGFVGVGSLDSFKYMDMPQINQWFFQQYQIVRGNIDQGTFVGEVSGERTAGVATAYQHALILGTAKLKFGLAIMQLNNMAGIMLGQCARMVDVLGERVTVGGITIGPDEIEKDFEFQVDFEASDESARLRKIETGLRMAAAQKISDETFRQEWAGITDDTEEKRRIYIETAMKSPEIQQMIMDEVKRMWLEAHPAPKPIQIAPVGGNGGGAGAEVPGATPTPEEQFVQPGSPEEQALVQQQMVRTGFPQPTGVR